MLRSRMLRVPTSCSAPPVEEIYPDGFATSIHVSGITEVLCGAHRGPHHFDGVATVVAKLFQIVAPDAAYFGQKDAQQILVIRRLVRDLDIPVRIVACPIVREPDGLAMSSRNAYLDPASRRQATALNRALDAAEATVAAGETNAGAVLDAARNVLTHAGIEPEYLELRSPDDLRELHAVDQRGASRGRRKGRAGATHRQPNPGAHAMSTRPVSPAAPSARPRVTIATLAAKKANGEPIVMITAYDYPSAQIAEAAGVDVVLVGDSAAMTVLGHESTVPVTVDEMLMLTAAVRRGLQHPAPGRRPAVRLLRGVRRAGRRDRAAVHQDHGMRRRQDRTRRLLGRPRPRDHRRRHPRHRARRTHAADRRDHRRLPVTGTHRRRGPRGLRERARPASRRMLRHRLRGHPDALSPTPSCRG